MGWLAGVTAGNRCRSFPGKRQNKREKRVIKVCSSYADLHLCGEFKKGVWGGGAELAARQRGEQCIMGAQAVSRHLPAVHSAAVFPCAAQ